jgi:type I restriction enzyme S subunit
MKNRWENKLLAEVTVIRPPKAEARERLAADALVSFAPMEDLGIDRKFLNAKRVKPFGSVIGSYTYFAEGDVLLAKITPCFENGKLGIAKDLKNGIGFGSSEFIVLRPQSTLSNEYLYYYLAREDFRNEGAVLMGGAVGQQRVPKEFIERYPIPLPPLPEQRRIVGILDEAFEGIATAKANAEKNLQNARALFECHLQSAFTVVGEQATLAELSDAITDGDHMPPPKSAHGVPFITISDIVKDTREIDFSNTFTVPDEYFRKLKPDKKPRVGDVLYTVTGATLGIPVLVTQQVDFCFQRHIGLIRPKPDTDSHWLSFALLSPQAFRQATVGSTGAAQKTVSLAVLRNITVPRIPLSQQRLTAAKLVTLSERTQRLASVYQRKLDSLEALKKSLLHQAFTGNLLSRP